MTTSEGDDGEKKRAREEEFRATGEVIAIRRAIGWGGAITPRTPRQNYKGRGFDQGWNRGAGISRLNVDSSQCLTSPHLQGSIWVGIHLLSTVDKAGFKR